jgi:hypothetical protein
MEMALLTRLTNVMIPLVESLWMLMAVKSIPMAMALLTPKTIVLLLQLEKVLTYSVVKLMTAVLEAVEMGPETAVMETATVLVTEAAMVMLMMIHNLEIISSKTI